MLYAWPDPLMLSLQCMADSTVSIECLARLHTVLTPYVTQQEYVIEDEASDSCSPLAVLQMTRICDCLLDDDREQLWDACSRSPCTVSREDWYVGHLFRTPPYWLQPLVIGDCRSKSVMVSSR
jgi:hypothetical protein